MHWQWPHMLLDCSPSSPIFMESLVICGMQMMPCTRAGSLSEVKHWWDSLVQSGLDFGESSQNMAHCQEGSI